MLTDKLVDLHNLRENYRPGRRSASNVQPSESDVVHDQIRLRQRPIVMIARIVVAVRTGHV